MQIAISITTHNRYKTFKQSYDQIIKYLPDGAKIVVIDDGSDIPCPEATFRFETPHGIAAAKNKAFELTQGADYHFAFDDDIFPIVKDWHLPYINSGQNHLCFTFDKFKNGKASGRVLIGLAKELKIYKEPCGCMLFYTKKALDTVGGMDIEYGRWAYEHVGHSMRIHNAGLTSWPFMDIADSLKLFYSLDWAQEVIRSLDPKIRKALAPRNEMKYNREKKSRKYISFMPPRNLILTSYFTGQKDPQRNERWVADITKLDPLIDSLQGCNLIVFNDCFDGDKYRGCELIKTKIDINPYFARWAAYLSYIKSNTDVYRAWCVDATDVTLQYSPFEDMKNDRLYIGDEDETIGNKWLQKHHSVPVFYDFYRTFRNRRLLNAGIVGGKRDQLIELFSDIIDLYNKYEGNLGMTDMAALNFIINNKYLHMITHGEQVNTIFKSYQSNNFSWFKHK